MSRVIRRARAGEAGLVLSLIRELAEYEKLSHEAEATEAMIAEALFADNPRLYCAIAAVMLDDWTLCRVSGPALARLERKAT
jgi:N-acetylglutamate synthase-like GNAT family acetyltransferase